MVDLLHDRNLLLERVLVELRVLLVDDLDGHIRATVLGHADLDDSKGAPGRRRGLVRSGVGEWGSAFWMPLPSAVAGLDVERSAGSCLFNGSTPGDAVMRAPALAKGQAAAIPGKNSPLLAVCRTTARSSRVCDICERSRVGEGEGLVSRGAYFPRVSPMS